MKTLTLSAQIENMDEINAFIGKELTRRGCGARERLQVALAVEEIFVNIASYAYYPETGLVEITADCLGEPPAMVIRFVDWGRPFNPLAGEVADIVYTAEERGIGGMGIRLIKKSVDKVNYEYVDGKNILTIEKRL